jgi:hypothetical protein
MDAGSFDELDMFRRIAASGVRALLIGRRALVVLGLPVLTADYDFWLHADDAGRLNEALAPLGLVPSRSPDEARKAGRYVLENSEHVDVLVARAVSTVDGQRVEFDAIWPRRVEHPLGDGVGVALPCLDDLIATKRFAARPRDSDDIRLLEILRTRGG